MNPLDKEEFTEFLKTINGNMPIHTEDKVTIPKTPFGYLPKNLMEQSVKINKKFIDSNQHIIEEIQYRDPKNLFATQMRDYQLELYRFYDILNHDNFYSSRLREGIIKPNLTEAREVGSMHVFGSMFMFGMNAVKTLGGTLETTTASTTNTFTADTLQGCSVVGVSGDYYDRVAFSINSGAAGDMRLGVYDDTGSTAPNNLYYETGAFGVANDYAWHSLTEFSLNTARTWIVFNCSSGAPSGNCDGAGSGRKARLGVAFGALPSSFGSPIDGGNVWQQKIGHS